MTGLYDMVLTNSGNLDARLPTTIRMENQDCQAGDALAPYTLTQQSLHWIFSQSPTPTLQNNQTINASTSRTVGWLRCSKLKKEDFSYATDATSSTIYHGFID